MKKSREQHRLTPNAQVLRKEMTKEERRLWYDFLKTLPITVHRQKIIGNYIADFYIAGVKLVIELDGSQHYCEQHQIKDALRDEYFNNQGITVKRYSNADIHYRFREVCEDIWNFLNF